MNHNEERLKILDLQVPTIEYTDGMIKTYLGKCDVTCNSKHSYI